MIRAAGVLFITPQRKVLFLKRGAGGDYPGAWCFPGGKQEEGETAEDAARREAIEEAGEPVAKVMKDLKPWSRRVAVDPVLLAPQAPPIDPTASAQTVGMAVQAASPDEVDFTTFLQKVEAEFPVTIDGEHVGYAWAPADQPPEPLHPGCRVALARFTMNELGVARAIAVGDLTSPQRYGNVSLFNMRITGTGVSYRSSVDEFVYRRPENYLTEDFLARCNGLQVIMLHPAKAMLTSKEFGARTVGAMMLPYLKGDEVWGVAKIYDDDAIELLNTKQMSTSPAVLLGGDDHRVKMEDGSDLLIEGKPSLVDHLAICERGVWDKGGTPSGVASVTVEARADAETTPVTQMTYGLDPRKLAAAALGMASIDICMRNCLPH